MFLKHGTIKAVMGQSYIITGGTGTFGCAFVRYLLANDVDRVIVYSRDEQKQWDMAREFPDERLRFFVGDVRDQVRLSLACRNVDVIVSAAALKIVPTLEYNPFEALKTNIIGAAQNVIMAALENNVGRVLYISSDKSVAPINAYGVSKAMGERLIVAANAYSGGDTPRFSAVRYGNVAGSRGSVIPLWRQQIERGEPLTLTSTKMTRYWMRIEQAVEFVNDALDRMKGGEIFIPELPSFRVEQLAGVMLSAASRNAYELIGMRPGEKLHERLIVSDEARRAYYVPGFGYVLTREPDLLIRDVAPDDGQCVPEGFSYDSESNTEWLDDEALAKELEYV